MLQAWLGKGNVVVRLLKCTGDPFSCMAEESRRQEQTDKLNEKVCKTDRDMGWKSFGNQI